jgi:F-type H+-transporting ATPase subunit gamma
MASSQELTRRIKSVKSTRKITRAMQMVSAAKMRKAQNATMASRTYADLAWELINTLGTLDGSLSKLLIKHPDAKKIGVVLISTNRGLVGGFNTNLLSKLKAITQSNPDKNFEIISVGRKGRDGVLRSKRNLIAEFPKHDHIEQVKDIFPVVRSITDAYKTGEYQKIVVIYSHFVSTLQQEARAKVLLPFGEVDSFTTEDEGVIYEPDKERVVKMLLPRILESQIYQAILENDASEHSARMVMMKNATEAAGDLIDDLTLTFNQLRQNKITTELSEITAGRIALEG